jgi:hypothetical protein
VDEKWIQLYGSLPALKTQLERFIPLNAAGQNTERPAEIRERSQYRNSSMLDEAGLSSRRNQQQRMPQYTEFVIDSD